MNKISIAVLLTLSVTCGVGYLAFVEHEKKHAQQIFEITYTLESRITKLEATVVSKDKEIAEMKPIVDKLKEHKQLYDAMTSRGTKIDRFNITAYSPLDDQNGINSNGNPHPHTSTGTDPDVGTFAVNPKIIPYQSTIVIVYDDGTIETGIAKDTGGALRRKGNLQIDVFRRWYTDALRHGRKQATVLWYE